MSLSMKVIVSEDGELLPLNSSWILLEWGGIFLLFVVNGSCDYVIVVNFKFVKQFSSTHMLVSCILLPF